MEFNIFKEHARQLAYNSYCSARDAHEYAFKDDRKKYDQIAAMFINDAFTSVNGLYLLLASNEEYQRDEFDHFFHKFDVFKSEIMSNIATDHSHQWTDIEFREFASACYSVFGLLSIDTSELDQYIN